MSRLYNHYLFKFTWKNIRRHFGRSFFIGFSVTLSVIIAVWVVAFFDGMNFQIEKAVVNTNTGYFQLQEKNYSYSTDSTQPQVFTQEIATQLTRPEILVVSPELVLDGHLSTPEGNASLVVLGIDPEFHKNLLPLEENITSGSFVKKNETGVVIGKSLADKFLLHVGDQIVINYQNHKGELRSELLEVRGVYHFNSQLFEKKFVYINQEEWQTLYFGEIKEPILFHRLVINTPDLKESTPLIEKLSQDLKLDMKTWKNLNPEMGVVLEFHDGIINFFLVILGITITMTIMTPVRMLWEERLPEMKMLNILGISKNHFKTIARYEVFIMSALSFLSALVILLIIIGWQSKTGLDFSHLSKNGIALERAGIKLPQIIYPRLAFHQIVLAICFVTFSISTCYAWSLKRSLPKLDQHS